MACQEAVYRTRDNLKNFHMRVELRKVTTSGGVGGASFLRESGPLAASRVTVAGGGGDTETWVFRWQEKVFSQHEEELYADAHNCTTAQEDKYHRDIIALRNQGGRPNNRLFSYLDSDTFRSPMEEVNPYLTGTDSVYETFVSRHSNAVRRRHTRMKAGGAFTDPVLETPTVDQRLTHRIITPPSQSMYIMADLRKMDGRDEADEHVLCTITVDCHGVVSVTPDFNRDRPAHRIESRHREVFDYRLQHASEPITDGEEFKEQGILSELYIRHASYLHSCVGNNFTNPPESEALRLVLLGEIVSAQGFEYDDLYITAHLELPEFWVLEDDTQSLSTVTQICRTKSRHKYNIAHFGCPLEYTLEYHNPTLTADDVPRHPRVVVQVSSLDYWDRHRTEGYGFLDLPSSPGTYDLTASTWRPSGTRILDKMRRFFIGGAPEIEHASYVAVPRDLEGTHLSKYGFRTESSGTVNLHFEIIHQSSSILEREESKDLSHALKYKGFKASVAAALNAYQRVKMKTTTRTATLQQ